MPTRMNRTLISLPAQDMRWMKTMSKRRGQSMAEMVREAVAEYRAHAEQLPDRGSALQATAGIWKERGVDALAYVRKLRSEWDR